MERLPILISALCVTLYWVTVIIKLIKLSPKIGKNPNIIPRERLGKRLRIIWAPIILLWIIQTWLGVFHPFQANDNLLAYIGAFFAVLATSLTFICWHKMSTSWRIGIDPKEKTQLIVTGPYQYVRHPIYTLSIILAISTWLTLPTFFLFLTIVTHISLLIAEALREEKYLINQHGEYYLKYTKMVGRFIPKNIIKRNEILKNGN